MKTYTLKLQPEVAKAIKMAAISSGKTMNVWITEAVEAKLAEAKKKCG